jgi:hypothetical protein
MVHDFWNSRRYEIFVHTSHFTPVCLWHVTTHAAIATRSPSRVPPKREQIHNHEVRGDRRDAWRRGVGGT